MDKFHGEGSPEAKTTPASYAEPAAKGKRDWQSESGFLNYVIVLNEKSGSADLPNLKRYMEEKARLLQKNVRFIELQKGMDLEAALQSSAGDADVLVAAGGDGTLAATAHIARRRSLLFAAIPCGTANVFAKEHGIPHQKEAAADLALTGRHVKPIDVLEVEGRTFLCHLSIGTYSEITLHTDPEAKRKYGRIAYMAHAIELMLKEKMWTFDIMMDGQQKKVRASTIMVTNAGSMGATQLRWGEGIVTDDGIAEICVFKARRLAHYGVLLWSFILRRQRHPLKSYFQVKDKAKISCHQKSILVRGDGEEIGQGGFEFRVIKHGLQVILPVPV